MRGGPEGHGAETQDRAEATGGGEAIGDEWDLERARGPREVDVDVRHAVRGETRERPLDELADNELVEPSRHDRDAPRARGERSTEGPHVRSSSTIETPAGASPSPSFPFRLPRR